MRVSLYIAKRYLFAKKSHNAINIISGISITGVATGTMALIVILSVFNGFDGLIKSLFSVFDPELKIVAVEGKTFQIAGDDSFESIRDHTGVASFIEVLEENALLVYGQRQHIARLKGVGENYTEREDLNKVITDGRFVLQDEFQNNYAVMGRALAGMLGVGLGFITPLEIYMPSRSARITMTPEQAFNRRLLFPAGIFAVEQEIDMSLVIVPLPFIRELLEFDTEVSSVELYVTPGHKVNQVQSDIEEIIGDKFRVLNRYQQNEWLYKVMQSEKWAIFLILSFILLIASFNVIGSLTMLIIEKKKDISVLQSLGADQSLIRKIFLFEGWMISVAGAVAGLIFGLLICLIQIHFGIIKLYGSGAFIIDAYPVELQFNDFVYVFLTVLTIGFFAAIIPVHYITKKVFDSTNFLQNN